MNSPVKKRYTAPSLVSIAIDQEIALVMTTCDGFPIGPNDECNTPAPPAPKGTSSKKSSPFGGTRPNYQ